MPLKGNGMMQLLLDSHLSGASSFNSHYLIINSGAYSDLFNFIEQLNVRKPPSPNIAELY